MQVQKLKPDEHMFLTENIIKILAQNRITTTSEFLQEDTEKLSSLSKLSLPQILAVRNDIFKKYSAPLVNGLELLDRFLPSKGFMSTGIQSLDAVMDGGIPFGHIMEVCGLADSGKTQLCFQIAINCVRNTENSVLYVDTKGDFSANRIQKLLDACGYSHKEMALIMYRIKVVHIWTMDELIELFKKLKHKTLVLKNLSLIIIDSLPSLMFQYLGDESKIGLTMLNILVNYSRFLCRELNIGIICVNVQTRWVDQDVADHEDRDDDGEHSTSALKDSMYYEKRIRCLGKYWQQIPALVLTLEKMQEKNTNESSDCSQVKVAVIKSSNCKNQNCILTISRLGVN